MLRLVSSALVGQHLKEVEDSVWGLELLPDLLADSTTLGAGLALGEHGSDALLHLGRGEVLGALTHRAIRGPVLDTEPRPARVSTHSWRPRRVRGRPEVPELGRALPALR
jgi:hypothetical protein